MKKATLPRLLLVFFLFSISTNLVHPVTPTFFKEIAFPDYMFGLAFACMSVGGFLFSPLWGSIADRFGYTKLIALGAIGYGLGQLVFMVSTSVPLTLAARLFSGTFSAATTVAGLTYVAKLATDQQRAKYMAYHTAIVSVGSASGYFIGGMLGTIGTHFTFMVQTAACIGVGAFTLLVLKELAPGGAEHSPIDRRQLNPISSFASMRKFMTVPLAVFFLTVMLANFGNTGFDNSFNYYIKDVLNFPTTYNGAIKAVVGLTGLVANFTINLYIASRTDGRKSIVPVLATCGITLICVPLIQSVPLFIGVAIIYFAFNSICLPIQQALVTRNGNGGAELFGAYNAIKTVGMVLGSLTAGFVYTLNNKLPFFISAAVFLLSAVLSVVNYIQFQKREAQSAHAKS